MALRARLALVTCCCLLVVAPVALGAAATASLPSGPYATAEGQETTTMVIQLRPDGDARWTVRTTFNLSTANETRAFRDLASRFENGDAAALGLPAFREASDEAAQASGREMAIVQVSRSNRTGNGTGTLVLSFTWTNFARQTEEGLVVSDAFNTSDGTWLPGLTRNQRLVMRPPPGYDYETAPKEFQNRTITWEGPREFSEGYFHVVLSGSVTETPPEQGGSLFWVALLVAGLGLGGGAIYVFLRDGGPGGDGDRPAGAARAEPASESASDGAAETATAAGAGETVDPADESGDDAATAGATAEAADDGLDPELLSDEERVERLLEDNGGRMKQASIVKETGWSNAKVSQLLSAMDEADRIDKLRIGRENLISLPDEDVTDIED